MKNAKFKDLTPKMLTEARESLAEAKVLLREKMSNRSVMNRLYYTMFYAVPAVMQDKQIGASKHSDVIAAFDREFVKNMGSGHRGVNVKL